MPIDRTTVMMDQKSKLSVTQTNEKEKERHTHAFVTKLLQLAQSTPVHALRPVRAKTRAGQG